MSFIAYCQSDPGRVRDINEDAVAIVPPPDAEHEQRLGHLFVLADGMGGAEAGEIASSQAVATISESYYEGGGSPSEALVAAIQAANGAVYRRAQAEGRLGMGTTAVAASIVGDKLYVAHVGDSRLYLIRGDTVAPLTRDHSLVAEQVEAGILTSDEAVRHPHRNVISRAVGTAPQVEVELSPNAPITLHEGDTVVICSDGLTEYVRPRELLQIAGTRAPAEAAPLLIDAANAGGGVDNISVLLIRYGAAPQGSDVTTQRAAVAGAATATAQMTAQMAAAPPPPPPPAAPPPRAEAPEPRRPALLLPALLVLLVLGAGAAALWSLFGDEFTAGLATPTLTLPGNLDEVPTATATVEGSTPTAATPTSGATDATATRTPPLTRTPRPTNTPRPTSAATPTVPAATATPAAASATPGAAAPSTPVAPSGPARLFTLVEPPDDATVLSAPLDFLAEVANLREGDRVQLRFYDEGNDIRRVMMSSAGGDRYVATVQRPPVLAPATFEWGIIVHSTERDANGSPVSYLFPTRHTLTWQPAAATASP